MVRTQVTWHAIGPECRLRAEILVSEGDGMTTGAGTLKRAASRLAELVAEGWFLPEYADAVRNDLKATAIP